VSFLPNITNGLTSLSDPELVHFALHCRLSVADAGSWLAFHQRCPYLRDWSWSADSVNILLDIDAVVPAREEGCEHRVELSCADVTAWNFVQQGSLLERYLDSQSVQRRSSGTSAIRRDFEEWGRHLGRPRAGDC
jgi:hypothetical protein